jgi:hypothetical protein
VSDVKLTQYRVNLAVNPTNLFGNHRLTVGSPHSIPVEEEEEEEEMGR